MRRTTLVEFILAQIDDFNREIVLTSQNKQLMKLLDTRGRQTKRGSSQGFEANPEHEPFDLKKLEKYGGRVAIRSGRNSVHTLYVVHHGKRESMEVFELDAGAKPSALIWVGCAVAPEPIGLSEAVALPDGGFIGTDFLARGPAGRR